jgi:hypothetical protein
VPHKNPEARRAWAKERYSRERERLRDYQANYHSKNRERVRQWRENYHESVGQEYIREYTKAWKKANADRVAGYESSPGRIAQRRDQRERVRVPNSVRRAEKKRALLSLIGSACAQCGYNENIAALDFDHINRSTKVAAIGSLIAAGAPDEMLIAEALKCQVLCANCHRVKTQSDFNSEHYAESVRGDHGDSPDMAYLAYFLEQEYMPVAA